jgi:polyisoprenyl-teichoic acid--peptidoglycan teichoic acid transferase
MDPGSRKRLILLGLAVAVVGAAVSTWVALSGGDGPPPSGASSPGSADTAPPRYPLKLRLGTVRVAGPSANVPVRLPRPTRSLRETVADLYTLGFVDPARWRGGEFPGLLGFFAEDARREARGDLEELTLGRAAARLSAVRVPRARLDVSFLVGQGRNPVTALATVEFSGVGLAGDARVPIGHRGEYVLRRAHGRWAIVSYEVARRIRKAPALPRSVRGRGEARFAPGVPSSDPLFILAIGSDARPGQAVAGARADSLHVIGINPRRGAASIVGIPRDSYVPIPGVGTRKINEALFYGGPELTVRTVEQLTGARIDAYVLTGFEGFRHLVRGVGGVEVRIPYAMSDPFSGAHFRAGRERLSGPKALAFSRNRHDAPGGDFGRSMNQGRLLVAALREFRSDMARDPVVLIRWLVVAARYLDTDLSFTEMVELLLAAPSIEPGRVKNTVVSGSGASVGGASVVQLGSSAQATFRDQARDGLLGGR